MLCTKAMNEGAFNVDLASPTCSQRTVVSFANTHTHTPNGIRSVFFFFSEPLDHCVCAIELYTNTCYSLFVVCRPCACRSLRVYRSSIESLYSVIEIRCDWRARHRSQSIRNLFWIMMKFNCISCIHVRQSDNDDNSVNPSFVSILALVWCMRSVWIFRHNLIYTFKQKLFLSIGLARQSPNRADLNESEWVEIYLTFEVLLCLDMCHSKSPCFIN